MISIIHLFERDADTDKKQYKVKDVNRKDYFTDIPPEEREWENQPKYANGESRVRIQDWLEIDAKKLHPDDTVASWGWSPNGKCYGWSHRAIYGFKIGDKIKKGDEIYNGKEYTLETKEQVEQAAKRFAKSVG